MPRLYKELGPSGASVSGGQKNRLTFLNFQNSKKKRVSSKSIWISTETLSTLPRNATSVLLLLGRLFVSINSSESLMEFLGASTSIWPLLLLLLSVETGLSRL
jgi:hypothetical protein